MARAQLSKQQRVETIGDRVADARRRLGVTLKRDILAAGLAKIAGVPASTVSRIESGDSEDPNEETVVRLATALRVSPVWLRYGAQPGMQIPVSPPDEATGGARDAE
jgi:transcriptional regulator with XRE-family HTH domain